jgi:hypothetical protein
MRLTPGQKTLYSNHRKLTEVMIASIEQKISITNVFKINSKVLFIVLKTPCCPLLAKSAINLIFGLEFT